MFFLLLCQQNLFTLSEDQQHSVMSKNLSDRFKTNRSKPPLVEIGGMRAKDGWVAISETGLVSYKLCRFGIFLHVSDKNVVV